MWTSRELLGKWRSCCSASGRKLPLNDRGEIGAPRAYLVSDHLESPILFSAFLMFASMHWKFTACQKVVIQRICSDSIYKFNGIQAFFLPQSKNISVASGRMATTFCMSGPVWTWAITEAACQVPVMTWQHDPASPWSGVLHPSRRQLSMKFTKTW